MTQRYNSRSLPYFYNCPNYPCHIGKVSFFDLDGTKHIVNEENFKDFTSDGGRFWQFYTFEVYEGGDPPDRRSEN